MNRKSIDEVFEIYVFNLVNSGMDIKFMKVSDLIYGDEYIVDWVTATVHDEYLREKLDIESEDERKIKMGLDICDNGTYWGFPIRYSRRKDHYAIYGGIHRFHSLRKIDELKLRDLSKRPFLCYDVNEGREITEILVEKYYNVFYANYMEDDYFEKLAEWENEKDEYLSTYYIVRKEHCILGNEICVSADANIQMKFSSVLSETVGEFSDDYYIIRTIKGLDYFNDKLTFCKNFINNFNVSDNERVLPHKMVRYEDEYEKHKDEYVFENFLNKHKDKIKLY